MPTDFFKWINAITAFIAHAITKIMANLKEMVSKCHIFYFQSKYGYVFTNDDSKNTITFFVLLKFLKLFKIYRKMAVMWPAYLLWYFHSPLRMLLLTLCFKSSQDVQTIVSGYAKILIISHFLWPQIPHLFYNIFSQHIEHNRDSYLRNQIMIT